jgi:hypothetical protein
MPYIAVPGEGESSRRQIVATDQATDAPAYEFYRLTGLRTGGSETRPYTPSDRAHRASVCAQHGLEKECRASPSPARARSTDTRSWLPIRRPTRCCMSPVGAGLRAAPTHRPPGAQGCFSAEHRLEKSNALHCRPGREPRTGGSETRPYAPPTGRTGVLLRGTQTGKVKCHILPSPARARAPDARSRLPIRRPTCWCMSPVGAGLRAAPTHRPPGGRGCFSAEHRLEKSNAIYCRPGRERDLQTPDRGCPSGDRRAGA